MKANQLIHTTTDRNGNPVSYGSDRQGSWLEFSDKGDRTAIYGNCRSNRERMRREIAERDIKLPAEHMNVFCEPLELAA